MDRALVRRDSGPIRSDGFRSVTFRLLGIPPALAGAGTRLHIEGPALRPARAAALTVTGDQTLAAELLLDERADGLLSLRVALDEDRRIALLPTESGLSTTQTLCFPLELISSRGEAVHIDYDYNSRLVDIWLTRGDERERLRFQGSTLAVAGPPTRSADVEVDSSGEYQVFEGMGAAMTESSAHLIAESPRRDDIMRLLFTRAGDGIGLDYVRVPLGASDFALDWYTYDDEGAGQNLSSFSIERDRRVILPILRQARRLNPSLRLMGTPWSAPGWMKEGSGGPFGLHGGALRPEMHQVFAEYLTRVMLAYREEGVELDTLSLQNEPLFDQAEYPCMFMPPETQADVIERLAPLMTAHQLSTQILVYDHNWDRPEYVEDVYQSLSNEAFERVAGSAWHGYEGQPHSQTQVRNAFPEKGIYFTEITGGSWDTHFSSILNWNMRNIVVGAIRNWAKSVMLWNLALDQEGGPSIRADADQVELRGVVRVTADSFSLSPEFYILGHVSKFVLPGAVRVASTHGGTSRSVAFRNSDGSVVLLVYNPNENRSESVRASVDGSFFEYTLAPRSVASFIVEAPSS